MLEASALATGLVRNHSQNCSQGNKVKRAITTRHCTFTSSVLRRVAQV